MRPMAILLCFVFAGCQTAWRSLTQEPQPIPVIRLCQRDVPAEESAIKQELMCHVVPGMPLDAARAQLEALGIRSFGSVPKTYRRSAVNLPELINGFDEKTARQVNRATFTFSSDEVGAWGQRCFELKVRIYFDENMAVTDFEIPYVPARGQRTPFAWYFSRHPNLREPLGMSIEQARGMMEAEGFRCAPVVADKREKSGRPFLYCRAVAETPLGGSIIRASFPRRRRENHRYLCAQGT